MNIKYEQCVVKIFFSTFTIILCGLQVYKELVKNNKLKFDI